LNNLVAWALTTGKVHLKSDGSAWRPIVHIEDISRAFIAALEAPRQVVHNQAFNVGQTLENYRVRQLAELVSFATGCELEFAAGAGPDVRNYRVNCDKIRRDLPSFTPRWTASQGIIELLEAYRRLGVDLDEFEGPRYKRIAHIQHLIDTGKIDSALRWTVGERVMGTRA
jgi:nucleoside-diphosphate-sugar epimerase